MTFSNKFCRGTALALALCAGLPATHAQAPEPDGIEVGKMSRFRNLLPADALEAQATQEYAALKAQAQQKGVLAAENDPQLQRLRKIAGRLIPHAKRWNNRADEWQWEVNLIGVDQVNAFCMPGGKIAFFTGILDKLKLTDDEVAIVMGHEMAHALREHGRARAAKGTALQLGAAAVSSLFGLGDLGQMVVGQGAQLTMLRFSRGDETDADIAGLDIAARAGYDPRAGIALWQKMGLVSKRAPPQWLSTHPAGENRITEMQKQLPQVMPVYARTQRTSVKALPPYQSNVREVSVVR